ncbi:hypothetical protein [Pontibacter harenae]|uniref:hypothetical protein n=1 Tax=Pontibacter harenae TaxID=2894083 RepID=UPI001E4A5CA2|nr:hypothetical protein [Pontibacter harenae]MCC9167597.1 hypothetical protein [Pontibacter harenae]
MEPTQAQPIHTYGLSKEPRSNKLFISKKLEETVKQQPLQEEPKDVIFWEITSKAPHIKLKQALFINFLEMNGFHKLYQDKLKLFVRVENNIIKAVTIDHIKDFVRKFIESLPMYLDEENGVTRYDLLEKVYKAASTYLSEANLSFIKELKPKYLRDTKDEGFIFYQNCFVKVTKDAVTCADYSNLQGHIWENQQKARNFVFNEANSTGDFGQLAFNISNKDQKRFESLRSAIGYLLHSYKDQALTKAIIFVDEQISQKDEANGGTCKSLVAKGIEKMKHSWYRGKGYKIDKSFAYQGINLDTQICLLDDVQENFSLEHIFTNITNSLTVEGKGQAAFTIPFEDSPKWLITTNYVIGGYGNSYDRRRHIVEFSDYYLNNPKPKEEFGKPLFEWDEEEWNRFDNFMLGCLQFYLQKGLQEIRVNYEERALLQSTSEEFVAFMETLEYNVEYEISALKERFLSQNPDFYKDQNFNNRIFQGWIRAYVKHKKILCQGDATAPGKSTGDKNAPFELRNGFSYIKMLF